MSTDADRPSIGKKMIASKMISCILFVVVMVQIVDSAPIKKSSHNNNKKRSSSVAHRLNDVEERLRKMENFLQDIQFSDDQINEINNKGIFLSI